MKSLNNCTFSVPYHGIVFSTNTQLAKRVIIGGASCRAATGSKLLTIGRYSTILLKQHSRLWTNQGIFGAHMVDIVIAKATGSPWSEVLGHPEGHLNGQDRRTFGPWHLSLGANIGFAYREDINEKKRFLSGIARIREAIPREKCSFF